MTTASQELVKLLPCPFCGSNTLQSEQTITDGSVQCLDCCGKMVKADEPTARKQWNTRALPGASQELVERLSEVFRYARTAAIAGNNKAKVAEFNDLQAAIAALPTAQAADQWEGLYNELLFAVSKKCEGESRHETALRYIRERDDTPVNGPCVGLPPPPAGEE